MLRVALELLLILFLARAVWRVIGGVIEGVAHPERVKPQRGTLMVRDPVCGTFVVPERAIVVTEGRGRVFFCSAKCRDAYRVRGETHDAHSHGSSAGRDPRGPRVA